jgi:ferrous iron transport protein A
MPSRPSLADLPVASRATLGAPAALDGTLVRLMEMGMTPGAIVEVTRRAALGDPLEILVRGTRVCLRRADAARFPVLAREGTP